MSTVGAFTVGAARLSRWEGVEYAADGQPSGIVAVYAAILACGTLATPTTVSGLPAVNAAHGTLANLRAQGYAFDQISDNKAGNDIWEIRVPYGRATATSEGEGVSSRITALEWGTHEWEQDLCYDEVEGFAFGTASGGTYDSAPQIIKHGRSVRIVRLQSDHPAAMLALTGSVNSSNVTVAGCTFAARTAKVRVSARDTLATEGLRYEVTIEILERNNVTTYGLVDVADDIGWDVAVLEADYYYLDGDGARVRFMEREEPEAGSDPETTAPLRPSATPQYLTVTGGDGRADSPVFRRWHTAPGAAWTALRLPS